MSAIICTNCSQSFGCKKTFVSHLVSKSCFKSVGEAAKAKRRLSRHKEEAPEYPTREFVPVQGCQGCKRYSRPGMQMYMLSHLTSHVVNVDTVMQDDQTPNVVSQLFQDVLDKMFHEEEDERENPSKRPKIEDLCNICDMAFQDAIVLDQHNVEIHSGA